MNTDRCGNTHRQKCHAKGSIKEAKLQQFMYRCTTNVKPKCKITPVTIRATGIVTKGLRKNFEAIPGNTFNRFTTKDNFTLNITRLKLESLAVRITIGSRVVPGRKGL